MTTKTSKNENTEKNIIDASEFAVAEEEANKTTDIYTHKLSNPFAYEGKVYEEFTFNWGKLTGQDSLSIESELQTLGKVVISPEFSSEYLVRMAVRACSVKISSNLISALPLRDYNRIRSKARSFLLATA